MNNIITIARHEIQSLFRERTFILLLAVFAAMTLASAYIGWSSQHTINQVYTAAAEQMRQSGKVAPSSPFADYPHLALLKNMIIYVIVIGGLLAISTAYSAGMRERKAGVLKLLFSRPVGKNDFLLGKLLGISFVLAVVMLLAAAISALSSAVLVSLNAQDMIHLFSFYGFSLVYLLGFAFIGFSSALVKEDEVMALLIPIIFWISITFVLPQLTSALYPTGSLNPTLPQTDILQSPILQTMHDAVYPFSISQHYKEAAATILNINAIGPDAQVHSGILNVVTTFCWMLLCLTASFIAVYSFDKSRW
ncbi:MAG TPA: ABC transporter permease subunit [Candidatus Methanoperedens sp.]|nr:ABC transporter permease subunit [Candidatus Methanoperedens sp.]